MAPCRKTGRRVSGPMVSPSTPATAPASLRTVADQVEDRLQRLLDHERVRWAQVDPDLAAPIDTLAGLVLGGGKRLRPAFCYWGFVGSGGTPSDPRIIDAGAAFELLQAFAVIHDDVMDGSPSRRGERTSHLVYADRHEAGLWRGEPRRFGEGVAILIGNMAHVLADQLVGDAAGGPLPVWDELRLELNMGQYLDMVGTARRDTQIDRAHLVARYKSGKYTVERPLHVGAALAGRPPEAEAGLSAYGDPVGEAFQLRDDWLDVYGDETLMGKRIGEDLREGKPTPLLAATVARCPENRRFLLDRVGSPDLTVDEVDAIRALMDEVGARAELESAIERLVERAVASLDGTALTLEARGALVELASFVATRTH
jgi:geranylgeranyl diphosphate synthase, type I